MDKLRALQYFVAAAEEGGLRGRLDERDVAGGGLARRRTGRGRVEDDQLGEARAGMVVQLAHVRKGARDEAEGAQVRIRQGVGEAILPALADPSVPEGCVRLARGIPETAALGEGEVALDIVRMEAVA